VYLDGKRVEMLSIVRSQTMVLANSVGLLGFWRGSVAYATRLTHRLIRPLKWTVRQFHVPGVLHPVFIRPGTNDWEIFQQVFMFRNYDVRSQEHNRAVRAYYVNLLSNSKIPVIIDCGANIGISTIWFAKEFPLATIFAVEPEPGNFAILRRNSAQYPNIKPIHAAISDRETKVYLQNSGDAPDAWQTKESESGNVETVTILDLLSESANSCAFIVKIDIEGSEVKLFRSNINWVEQTPLVVFEEHDWLFNWGGTGHAIFSVLTQHPRDYLRQGEATLSFSHSLLSRVTPPNREGSGKT
jgi:FkbM family methyltransferase